MKESDGIKKDQIYPPLHGDRRCSLDPLVDIVMAVHSVKLRAGIVLIIRESWHESFVVVFDTYRHKCFTESS